MCRPTTTGSLFFHLTTQKQNRTSRRTSNPIQNDTKKYGRTKMVSIVVGTVLLVLLARRSQAGVIPPSELQHRPHGTCQQFTIPVYASANSAIYNIQPVNNDIDAISYAIHADTWSSPAGPAAILKNTTTSGIFNIHAQLYLPNANASSKKANLLQIATHGLRYDSRYWDPKLNDSANSYVDAILAAGYPILTYDRLGVGQSDKPDAYTVVQAPLELEILHQLTLMAWNGTLYTLAEEANAQTTKHSPFQPPTNPPTSIIHVGHSFGSVLTSAYLSLHGQYSSAALITGYVPNPYLGTVGAASFSLSYANTSAATPLSTYSHFPPGYVLSTPPGIQPVFFGGNTHTSPPSYTPEQLHYGIDIHQPFPVGEYTSAYTIAELGNTPSTSFTGPLLYVLPEYDFYICGGDCKGVYDVDVLKGIYRGAKSVDGRIQPDTGHALTLHNNATGGYELMFEFLSRNGF